MGKSTAESYIKRLLPVLKNAQSRLKVLPKSTLRHFDRLSARKDAPYPPSLVGAASPVAV